MQQTQPVDSETKRSQMLRAIRIDIRPEIGRAIQEMIREEDNASALYSVKADRLERNAALLHEIPEFVKWAEASAQKFREMAAQERGHRDKLQDMLRELQSLQLE